MININIFSRFFNRIFPADLKEELEKEKDYLLILLFSAVFYLNISSRSQRRTGEGERVSERD